MTQKKQPLKYQAYEFIKSNIVSCAYAPGMIINEELIHEQIGASRTPIRDALSRLEQEGLVQILPKKGVLVTRITLKELNTLYETRFLLEPYALRKYGSRIPQEIFVSYYQKYSAFLENQNLPYSFSEMDEQFHRLIIDATENSYFTSMYSTIESQIARTRFLTGNLSADRRVQTIREHIAVVEAALKGDWDRAADALLHHLHQSKNSSFDHLLQKDQPFRDIL